MRSVVPVSYSSLSAYNTCPRQFYELRIAKNFVEPESESLKWGNYVHKSLEDYVKYNTPLPENVRRYQKVVDKIVAAPGDTYVEIELGITAEGQPCGFWDSACFLRGKGDIVKVNLETYKGFAGDYKTGKKKPDMFQLEIMSALVMAVFPDLEEMIGSLLWLPPPFSTTTAVYKRDLIPSTLERVKEESANMLFSQENNVWPEKPSGLCKPNPRTGFAGCPVTTCKYNGRRK